MMLPPLEPTLLKLSANMNRLHVIGHKNHGKTQLVVELVAELSARGLRVGTIKHTHHQHELDVPGKDSHRHRAAGAAAVGVLSRSMSAIFLPVEQYELMGDDRYVALAPSFDKCDIVLVEGDSQTTSPKIEVWRAELSDKPMAQQDDSILAVVSNDAVDIPTKVLSRSNVANLADWIFGDVLDITANQP
jgi:molybdopterin-guanine dinucleotide biosynthesis protein B